MQTKQTIDLKKLFEKVLEDKIDDFTLPPPVFSIMQAEVIAYDEIKKSLTIKLPVLKQWLNPYGTMQGGMIDAAIDNAIGPLSMLVAPPSMTRIIETKLIKTITTDEEYIYVKAHLIEHKKRRLTFDASVEDAVGTVYARSKMVNYIIDKN